MKLLPPFLLSLFCLSLCSVALAETVIPALFKDKVCMGCHQLDAKRVGPAFRAIAIRYQGQSEMTPALLAQRILHGGKGQWGVIAMPQQYALVDSDALVMAQWILELAEPSATPQ